MQFFAEEQYMQDPVVVGIATTLLTEVAKRSKWKWLSWVDPSKPEQIKLVAGGLSLALMVIRRLQTGDINQGNAYESIKMLVVSWLVAWTISHFAYQSVPFVKTPAVELPEKPADGSQA